MDNSFTEHQVMRDIGMMERAVPNSWQGAGMWADMTQHAARLIVGLADHLEPSQRLSLMTIGAMAHRQHLAECKAEEARHG